MSCHGERVISLLIIEEVSIFFFTCLGQDSMFGIYGDDIEKKEFDEADFSAKGNNTHPS